MNSKCPKCGRACEPWNYDPRFFKMCRQCQAWQNQRLSGFKLKNRKHPRYPFDRIQVHE